LAKPFLSYKLPLFGSNPTQEDKMSSMSRERFLQEYKLELDKEFERDSVPAEWAPKTSGSRLWGEEDEKFVLAQGDPNQSNVPSAAFAVSPDWKCFAGATNAVIRIYEPGNNGLRQKAELIGHETNVWKLRFFPTPNDGDGYLLLSEGASVRNSDGMIILWHLDGQGRLENKVMPIAVNNLAGQASAIIGSQLKQHHELEEADLETVRSGFAEVLQKVDTSNRTKSLPNLDGHFPSFGSEYLSHDGKKILYITHGRSTQGGMRPEDQLPQIVVYDLPSSKEICRLKGHQDAIMWASFSPDDKTIVTASWDETYGIWDASTGHPRRLIGPTHGQNWAGAISPDGSYVLLSGGSPTKVAIYALETGEEIATFEHEKLRGWVRRISWNPSTNEIALVNKQSVILWHPFEGKKQEVLKLKNDGSMLDGFCGLSSVEWVEGGKKLLVETSEGTVLVWEPERNVKWRFQRPHGTPLKTSEGKLIFRSEGQSLVSLNGDGVVRAWYLNEFPPEGSGFGILGGGGGE
jgi:hypothetical protein